MIRRIKSIDDKQYGRFGLIPLLSEKQDRYYKHCLFMLNHQSNQYTGAGFVHSREQVPSQASNVEEYCRFFRNIESSAYRTLKLEKTLLDEHGIRLTSNEFTGATLEELYRRPRVLVMNVERGASIIDYDILLGPYIVAVRMLNIDQRTSDKLADYLGTGGFGRIVVLRDEQEEFVSKRIQFQNRVFLKKQSNEGKEWYIDASFSQVKQVLMEYAFARVCSLLGVGPRLKRDIGFDLVCYRDCIEFFMEKCESIDTKIANYGWNEADSLRLKYCVRVMHCHHFIHRDIKPANVVWSPHVGQYVLCDFGIACVVAESLGFKSLTNNCGTITYMSKDMKQLQGEGLIDLYHNDMHSMALTINELGQIKFSRKQLVCISGPPQPTARIMLLKTLRRLLDRTSLKPLEPSCLPSKISSQLRLAEATALIQAPKVQFLLNSMEISFQMQTILEESEQNSEYMNIVSKMVSNFTARPSFVKQKYQELDQLGKYVLPARLRQAKYKQLIRLSHSMLLSPQEQTRRRLLLVEYLMQALTKVTLTKPMSDLLREFMTQPVLPGQESSYKAIQLLCRLRSGQLLQICQQVRQLSEDTFFNVSKYLFIKGEYKTCFEVILQFGGGSNAKNYGWFLQNLLNLYEHTGDREFLDHQALELGFAKAEIQPESWPWLKQLGLLALALLYRDPERCCGLCLKYIFILSIHTRKSLIAILVRSYQLQEKIEEAISWQRQLIALLKSTAPAEESAILFAHVRLIELQEDLPSPDLNSLVRQALVLAHEQKRKFGTNADVLNLNNKAASLLIRQGKYKEADVLLSSLEEAMINQELGYVGGIIYYSQKLSVKCKILDNTKIKPEGQRCQSASKSL